MYTPRKLEWDDALTTGDMEIDAQHRYLIDVFNDLGKTIEEDQHDKEDIERVLSVMNFYAGWHFGREEDCFAQYNCPAAEKNIKAHAVFIEKLNTYRNEFEQTSDPKEMALKLHEELSDWIVNHILAVDGQLYPCIHNRPKPSNS